MQYDQVIVGAGPLALTKGMLARALFVEMVLAQAERIAERPEAGHIRRVLDKMWTETMLPERKACEKKAEVIFACAADQP